MQEYPSKLHFDFMLDENGNNIYNYDIPPKTRYVGRVRRNLVQSVV